jgi:hypothetical protein
MQLHPIIYVADQYAERDFYARFGFETVYEGDEFPGFLAIKCGEAVIGLQQASAENPAYSGGLRWQFELEGSEEIAAMIDVCQAHELEHEVLEERGGDLVKQLVRVVSPSGVAVWFEGPNEPV